MHLLFVHRGYIIGSRIHAAQNAFGVDMDQLQNQFIHTIGTAGLSSPAAKCAEDVGQNVPRVWAKMC